MADLSEIADIATIVQTAWPVLTATGVIGALTGVGGTIAYGKLFRKKERRLLKNLQRKVAVVPARTGSMDHEIRLLQDVDFFIVDPLAADSRSIDTLNTKYRLAVLQYDDSDEGHFWSTYESLQTKQVPVIVYAKPDEIRRDRDDLKRIQSYSLHTMCNTPLRLISDVASIMSTYPEDK
ncbi:MAG: hypothetical protein JWM52_620 [Candidatus Saccharibacteria bacterium]|nr:hypothetical protein [Candidatus Saccharibacteria bacterium]